MFRELMLFMLAPWLLIAANAGPRVDTYAQIPAPLYFGDSFWDESGAPNAPAQIVVDLEAEQLYVYRGGVEIARAMIARGWEEYATPEGSFPILEKDADHVSSTYGGAPMPYNLRLTWAGVAIHGADVDDMAATHGCIGVPMDFARKLFRNMRVGDRVLVTRNWRPDLYAPQTLANN
ncbi:MAG: L,D-transpeptidase family protein [Parasphingorhabdus sp.]|nr:L,D-transpeptidase family protein [Parasphingorhabdus sp.]